jgi:hypothetical protein
MTNFVAVNQDRKHRFDCIRQIVSKSWLLRTKLVKVGRRSAFPPLLRSS